MRIPRRAPPTAATPRPTSSATQVMPAVHHSTVRRRLGGRGGTGDHGSGGQGTEDDGPRGQGGGNDGPGAEGTDGQHVPRGTEYYLGENRGNERVFAHALVTAGADLVLASGPHVLRGLRLFHEKLIAYSLGNFAMCSHALSMDGGRVVAKAS